MPLVLDAKKTIKVVVSRDSAVGAPEAYQDYLQSLDESVLELTAEPTRFVLNTVLDYRDQERVMSMQTKTTHTGQVSLDMSYMLEEVRCALVDIENPDDVPELQRIKWKRESDQRTSKALMAQLNSAGIVTDLYTALTAAKDGPKTDELAKKN